MPAQSSSFTSPLNAGTDQIQIRKSNKIHIKILLTISCVVVFLNAKIYVFVLYKTAFHFLIFNLERHQRELFNPGLL